MSDSDVPRPVLRLVTDDERVEAPVTDDPVLDVDEDLPPEVVDFLVAAYKNEHGLPADTDPDRF